MTTVRAGNPPQAPVANGKRRVSGRVTFVVGLVVCAGAALGALLLAPVTDDDGPTTGGSGTSAITSGVTEYASGDRGEPIALGGTTLTGDDVQLEQLRGAVVVVNVWGSWCAPCREEAPVLAEADRSYPQSDVRFLGINVRDNESSALAFERRYGIRYPSIADFDGQTLLQVNDYVPVNVVPVSLVLDREGRVAARILGPVRRATLSALLETVLTEPGPSSGRAVEEEPAGRAAPAIHGKDRPSE